MKAALDQLLERDAVVLDDRREADVNFFLIVFGTYIECRTRLRHGAKPLLAGDVRHVLRQFNDRLAGATFTGEEAGLIEWYAVANSPLAFRDGLVVPVRHVGPVERVAGAEIIQVWNDAVVVTVRPSVREPVVLQAVYGRSIVVGNIGVRIDVLRLAQCLPAIGSRNHCSKIPSSKSLSMRR